MEGGDPDTVTSHRNPVCQVPDLKINVARGESYFRCGSIASFWPWSSYFRSTPRNGHRPTGPV